MIDGYHAFMALPTPFQGTAAQSAFISVAVTNTRWRRGLRVPSCRSGLRPRPPVTGWFAEFED